MSADQIDEILQANPFVPFTLHLASGRKYRVDHPDFAMLTRGRHVLTVGLEGDAVALVDLLLVSDLETHPRGETNAASS
ncbi:MAG: hypothetical protein EXS37_14950 [Opitutus sp.]|nr:hypothetical protein [Opitutus sp.]